MLALAADLLQAEDVSVQPDELRPQHRNSLLQARPAVMPVVQVHEVEGGDAQLGGHSWWEVGEALDLFLLAGMVCSAEVWNASRELAVPVCFPYRSRSGCPLCYSPKTTIMLFLVSPRCL